MITVKSIAGESYDLASGSQIPKSLVITNGLREINIAVSDEVALEVLALMVELKEHHQDLRKIAGGPIHGGPPVPVTKVIHSVAPPTQTEEEPESEVRTNLFKGQVSPATPNVAPHHSSFAEEEKSLLEPAGNGPGSEYDDENTGVESL